MDSFRIQMFYENSFPPLVSIRSNYPWIIHFKCNWPSFWAFKSHLFLFMTQCSDSVENLILETSFGFKIFFFKKDFPSKVFSASHSYRSCKIYCKLVLVWIIKVIVELNWNFFSFHFSFHKLCVMWPKWWNYCY